MNRKTWLLAAAMVLACSAASAQDRIRFTAPDGVNGVNVSTATPLPVVGGGWSQLATAQTTIQSTATLIVALRTGRGEVTVENTTTTPIYVGGASVTTTTGMLLPGAVGASITLKFQGALYGVAATSAVVTEYELY